MDFVVGDHSSENERGSNPGDHPDPTLTVQSPSPSPPLPLRKALRRLLHRALWNSHRRLLLCCVRPREIDRCFRCMAVRECFELGFSH
uniref:Uncharacterized protein n=1 Tax=Cannabis sativa TaxID=3483 RepID=A0A803PYR1_CANSA